MFPSWLSGAMLAAESQEVIWLRLMRLGAGGSNAADEAILMVSEKLVAASYATERLMRGDAPESVVSDYRQKVRANARRLCK